MTARKRHWAAFASAMTVAVCGTVWLGASWDDVRRGNGVSVDRETKSPEEIRKYWTPERIRQAEPMEMPAWDPCEHFPSQLSPDCW
ncbi:hypothetical protein [Streptomyces sp. HD]|uniref:hypothetical protein n=1 Tax=Streptomyces sp. HD TaxID=3020892 RepID=UPI00232FFDD0|nr:hypothetical protein [Streptomyces sp. HD]MDC0768266.1 hypothetical protein [Streptomyces sp. HD]